MLKRLEALAQEESRDPHRAGVAAAIFDKSGRPIGQGVSNFLNPDSETPERWEKTAKQPWVFHAEVEAIHDAYYQTRGRPWGGVIVTTYFPCSACANHIVRAGLRCVVSPEPDFNHPRRGADWAVAVQILEENGVEIRKPGVLAGVPEPAAATG